MSDIHSALQTLLSAVDQTMDGTYNPEATHVEDLAVEFITTYREELSTLVSALRERDLLANGIRDAAVRANIARPDAVLNGPHLLMLCDDLATAAITPPELTGELVGIAAKEIERGTTAKGYGWSERLFNIWWTRDPNFCDNVNTWSYFTGTKKQKRFYEAGLGLTAVWKALTCTDETSSTTQPVLRSGSLGANVEVLRAFCCNDETAWKALLDVMRRLSLLEYPQARPEPAQENLSVKMHEDHYDYMAIRLDELGLDALRSFLTTYHRSNLTHKQYRWDMLYKSQLLAGDSVTNPEWPVYDYLNDEHIDTALRQYCRQRDLIIEGWS